MGDEGIQHLMMAFLKGYDNALEHYDFVISDISSDIANPLLEQSKKPALDFLQAMRYEWQSCRDDIQARLDRVQNQEDN